MPPANDHDADGQKNAQKDQLAMRLVACIGRLDDAIATARTGTVPDVRPIESEVNDLLAALKTAPIETGHALSAEIADMIGRLEMLEMHLEDLRPVPPAELN